MPRPEASHRFQTAVLWNFAGFDQYGEPTVASPVELSPDGDPANLDNGVRWNNKRTEMVDAKGFRIALDATVHVSPDLEVAAGSRIWLGTLAEWNAAGSGSVPSEVMEVKAFNAVQDVKGNALRTEIGLMRWHDK